MRRDGSTLYVAVALGVATGLCFAMVALRVRLSDEYKYFFIPGNLILAWLPLGFALASRRLFRGTTHRHRLGGTAFAALWLLFLPNAPYVVTDLMHYRTSVALPAWFDPLMFGAFAITGVALGTASLYLMHDLVTRAGGWAAGWTFALGSAGITGVGVYLGRVLRWNSWEAIVRPGEILVDCLSLLRHPWLHQGEWALIVAYALFFVVAYAVFYATAGLSAGLRERD